MRSRVIGMPINEAMRQHVMRDVERRVLSSGFLGTYNSQPDPCERIRDAERSGRILPSFARAAQNLVRQGRLDASGVDQFIANMSCRPLGAVVGRYEDDEE